MTSTDQSQSDHSRQSVMRWGGLSLFMAAALLVVFIALVAITGQTLPVPVEEVLKNPTPPIRLFTVAALGEFLLMPGALALFFALKTVDRVWALLGAATWFVAVPMFLASRGLIFALAALSASYIETTDPVLQSALFASAKLALETQNSYATMALLALSAGSIAFGVVMAKGGVLGKPLGYLTILAGALSALSPFAVLMHIPLLFSFAGLALSAVWQLIAGIRLFRMGAVT